MIHAALTAAATLLASLPELALEYRALSPSAPALLALTLRDEGDEVVEAVHVRFVHGTDSDVDPSLAVVLARTAGGAVVARGALANVDAAAVRRAFPGAAGDVVVTRGIGAVSTALTVLFDRARPALFPGEIVF